MRILLFILLFSFTGTGNSEIRKISVMINGIEIGMEIADTPHLRSRGLMYRKNLPEKSGMLFIHEHEDYLSYWMKNCFISLDMIFLNRNKEVVHIFKNVPPCREFFCSSYTTPVKAKYVIELNAGYAKKLKIKKGQKISFSI